MNQALRIVEPGKEHWFQELVKQVVQVGMPHDKYEIAAILETSGWNDKRAREVFGVKDIFALSEQLLIIIQEKYPAEESRARRKIGTGKYLKRVVRSFLRGLIFALPMAVSVTAMLILRFSLWSYEYLSVSAATSIAIGTIISFVVVGGFIQSLARSGFSYLCQGHVTLSRKIVYYFVRVGFITTLITTLTFLFFNWLLAIYPWQMTVLIVLYLVFLSAIWLSVAVMYILQKEVVFTGLITAGIAIVFLFFRVFRFNIIVSQLIALGIVAVSAVIITHFLFLRTEKKDKGIAPALPKRSILFYKLFPYFKYGFLYFLFLNLDRIFAWSTNYEYMPYIIWFRGEYELGLDFALLVLILPMGLIEVVVNELMMRLAIEQKNYSFKDLDKFNAFFKRFFYKKFLEVMIFCIVNGVCIFFLVWLLETYQLIHLSIFGNAVTFFVFIWALLSYSLLALGLMNTLILFSLSQPFAVSNSMLIATLANIFLGFALSRWLYYYWAVLGLLAGALVFFVLTFLRVRKVLSRTDFHLYEAQ